MENRAIIEKAIQKAIDGGWLLETGDIPMSRKASFPHEPKDVLAYYGVMTAADYNKVIFNHDFAKALWPSEREYLYQMHYHVHSMPEWQYRLQQMVVSEDPIKYLGENI